MKLLIRFLAVLIVLSVQSGHAQSWVFHRVDATGIRPDIAMDSQGNAHIAYWKTTMPGDFYINHAKWNPSTQAFDIQANYDGNPETFVSIALDQSDMPHMTAHDHGGWQVLHVFDVAGVLVSELFGIVPDHDGWSSSIDIDSQDHMHVSFLPECCGVGTQGLEYAKYDGTTWTSEYIGSGPELWIYNGTSLAVDSQDNPHITYYFDAGQALMHAVKSAGVWTFEVVDGVGDVGRYSSLAIDANDLPRVSYYQYLTTNSGIVKHASFDGVQWVITTLDTVDNLLIGPQSQGMISMAIDAAGKSHIVYSTSEVLTYATLEGTNLTKEVIVDYSAIDTSLGGRASLALDSFGRPHIAYGVVQQVNNWCIYAMKPGIAPVVSDIPNQVIVSGGRFAAIPLDNYVSDADNVDSEMTWTWSGNSALTVSYDSVRRRARVRAPRTFTGAEKITFTATDPDGFSDSDAAIFTVNATSVDNPSGKALEIASPAIEGNYPNPFNPSTTIRYRLNEDGLVRLAVYNTLGQEVALLVNEFQSAGSRSAVWNGTNETGESASSGVYVYRLSADGVVQTGRMILAK